MAYFGGSHGMRGDPGFFGTLFGAAKGLVRGALGIPQRGGFRPPAGVSQAGTPTGTFRNLGGQIVPVPGARGLAQRFVPGGRTGFEMVPFRRRRRMNAGNPKALRRAIRRQNAFVNLAKGALKNSGFKVVSTSAGKVSRATMDKAVTKARHDAAHHG